MCTLHGHKITQINGISKRSRIMCTRFKNAENENMRCVWMRHRERTKRHTTLKDVRQHVEITEKLTYLVSAFVCTDQRTKRSKFTLEPQPQHWALHRCFVEHKLSMFIVFACFFLSILNGLFFQMKLSLNHSNCWTIISNAV